MTDKTPSLADRLEEQREELLHIGHAEEVTGRILGVTAELRTIVAEVKALEGSASLHARCSDISEATVARQHAKIAALQSALDAAKAKPDV